MVDAFPVSDWFNLMGLAALIGAGGQGARMIVGLKKVNDATSAQAGAGVPVTGMIVDLGLLERSMEDARDALDHRFLDEINDLGPATMENLSRGIWDRLHPVVHNLHRVSVHRDSSGETCSYWGEEASA